MAEVDQFHGKENGLGSAICDKKEGVLQWLKYFLYAPR